MLTELRAKSQITIPKEIVSQMGLTAGDQLEVFERDGVICLMPVVIYPKKYVDELQSEVARLKENIAVGTQPVANSVDELFAQLENK